MEKKDQSIPFRSEPHAIEVLVASLLDPPDIDQRVQEYDWYASLVAKVVRLTCVRYTHYHADDLSSQTLGEEKDLQVYVRAARLAEGEDVDRLLSSHEGTATWGGHGDDVVRANAQFYETWLKA